MDISTLMSAITVALDNLDLDYSSDSQLPHLRGEACFEAHTEPSNRDID